MQHIFTVTTPFFALVLLGWRVARYGMLPLDAIPGLNVFVLFFALPCMLFRFSATTPIAQLLDASAVAVYLGSALAMVALATARARQRRLGWSDAAFGALVAAFPNSGFMGVPLMVALLGQAAAAPAIVALALDMVVNVLGKTAHVTVGRACFSEYCRVATQRRWTVSPAAKVLANRSSVSDGRYRSNFASGGFSRGRALFSIPRSPPRKGRISRSARWPD